ncbi:uncharacterized protein LOC121250586 [Juglans microcarpa x Juglans regia]|uniref:uncharacterized protein LOC121250586 n=1 Tax=Juglans microcarpa x Juglans regia TaxID=2249226 RepID=UPI001B7E74D5|nr:uncharacterized protein LOC121250586 [Juglans microcarpa x Juglans regia]XP_041005673.1 uncharacterized protein LOC121250586 [Juglans microcarpa x Juglans regia]XP_041005674.1 uncharacterized protein LOC121250586 [Juglans microcarpa x Juglans regia]
MVRPKDPFWKYAKDLKNGRFCCNFCEREFPGGISRIKWHLSGHKGHDIEVCEKVPQDIQLAVRQVLNTPNKKAKRSSQVEDVNHSILSPSRGPNLHTENISNNVREGTDNLSTRPASSSLAPNACNEQLAKLFFFLGIDPEAVVSPIFKDFVKSIVEYGPGYQPPSLSTLCTELMSDVEMKVEEYVENFIKNDSFQACGCTLMVNIWNDCSDFCLRDSDRVDIFAYSQRDVVCLNSFNYWSTKDIHTVIQEAISAAIEFLGPRHIVQLICNGDGDYFFEKYPWICVNYCAVDVFYLDFRTRSPSKVNSLIELVRLIFSYACHHSNVLSFRRGTKIPKEDCASIVFMFKSVLEVEDELQAMQFSMITSRSDRVKLLGEQKVAEHLRCAKFIDYIIRHKEFWSRVKATAQVFFLLFQTQCLVNCEGSSIGYLYEMVERLSDGIDKSRNYDCFLYDLIWEKFIDMREQIIKPIHAAAAFLNPTYMCSDNFKYNVDMKEGMDYVFENMVESEEKEAFTKEVQQYRTKMPKLFTAQAMTMLKTCHPRIWWDYCGIHTPVLRKYAIRILSQPVSTSICKHYQVPQIWRSEDNEDWSEKVNTMIMNRNNCFESLGLEPIVLDELGGEDHDAFKDVEELVDEDDLDVLSEIIDDTDLDRVIEDQRLSWLDDFDLDSSCFI